jgi:putative ATPase
VAVTDDLFHKSPTPPLAEALRPKTLDEVLGQKDLLGEGKPLRLAFESGKAHSMILWGPPGTGKTTLARLMAGAFKSEFIALSAVLSGVKEIRSAIDQAQLNLDQYRKPTILFIDEIHRFNKGQQDALLPYVESGLVTFIGATTENPSFEVNSALLSRAQVYVLKPLSEEELGELFDRATEAVLAGLRFEPEARKLLVGYADGDARRLLNLLEQVGSAALSREPAAKGKRDSTQTSHPLSPPSGRGEILGADAPASSEKNEGTNSFAFKDQAASLVPEGQPHVSHRIHSVAKKIDAAFVQNSLSPSLRRFDKGGENFYDQISALHKSMRGSHPDAALYYFTRMIDGGADPRYLARRIIRFAWEDVGLADPRAAQIALAAADTYERLGSPEGELALAQAVLYLSVAAKSNAGYKAHLAAVDFVKHDKSREVPIHLRNAPTRLMKELGYGHEYRYAHDEPGGYAAGESYLPEGMKEPGWYKPVDRGLEIQIIEKLKQLRELDKKAGK